MTEVATHYQPLSHEELARISTQGVVVEYACGDSIFSEGDAADNIYFVVTGSVSIKIHKFTVLEEIGQLHAGEYFGEMGIFTEQKRTASANAVGKTQLVRIDKAHFLQLIEQDHDIACKINYLLNKRNEELMLRENLMDTTGVHRKHLHISIKGDPSLRESTFTRQRYASVVDAILPELIASLKEIMLNRSPYNIYVGFNNGEVRTSSVFDPFCEEVHSATRLVEAGYIDRHFPKLAFDNKKNIIDRIYQSIRTDPDFGGISENCRRMYSGMYDGWEPITAEEVTNTLDRLQDLRDIPDFYLRNFTINFTKSAIRIQFNCDGTHIVSPDDYQRFIEQNI